MSVPSSAQWQASRMKKRSGIRFNGRHKKWTCHDERNCTQVEQMVPVFDARRELSRRLRSGRPFGSGLL
jgi:hypothetical protein